MPSRLAISSMSLGRAWLHDLPNKLDQAHQYGFQGIELFYEDLEYLARGTYHDTAAESLLAAAAFVRQLCDERDLAIVSLGPFGHCEGLRDYAARDKMFRRLDAWMDIALVLGTDIIQIPSSFLPAEDTSDDMKRIVADLTEVADRGARRGLRFAYEALCWGTHNDLWEQSWQIVQAVDRPNFGLCLDTFNIAGRIYADPTARSGKTPTADEDVEKSLLRMVNTVDVRKVFYVEVVDAERLEKPITPEHEYYDPSQPPRMSWSRNCRLFYGETDRGAYLPIKKISKALLEKQEGLGFEGWVSFELFNRSMIDPHPDTPKEHARRGAEAWRKLQQDVDFEVDSSPYIKAL